jgi:hypothetical protein
MAEDESEKPIMKARITKRKYDIFDYIRRQRYVLKKAWESKRNLLNPVLKPITKNHIAYLTLLVVIANVFLAYSSHRANTRAEKANKRAEKLFVGQNKPLIDVTPIGIYTGIAKNGNKMCATLYSILNYSGFDANNISVDIAYEGNVYISEWLRAKKDSERKKKEGVDPNVILNYLYPSRPDVQIPELKSGEVKEYRGASGSLDLDKRVVDMGKKGFPVLIRVTWENDIGHVFDEIRKYKLLCTKEGIGHAFTFIPEGIISQTHYGDHNSTEKNE